MTKTEEKFQPLITALFQPRYVLLCSLIGALIVGLYLLRYEYVRAMLVSTRSNIVRIASILVLCQTLFLKFYVWGDFVTSNVGMVLGCALALLVTWVSKRSLAENIP